MAYVITTSEARNFKRARIVWPLLYVLIVVALKLNAPPLVVYSFVAAAALVTAYLVFCRCPRCRKLFGVSLTWSEPNPFFGIVWPYFSKCIHCGAPLQTRTPKVRT